MGLQFDDFIKKVDVLLLMLGMSFDKRDIKRSTIRRLIYHWKSPIHLVNLNFSILSQLIWLVKGIIDGETLVQITYLLPCVTMCILGVFKFCSFIYNVHHIHDVINRLSTLECMKQSSEQITGNYLMSMWLMFLLNVFRLLLILTATGVANFATGPLLIMASHYYTTGEIKYFLPFILWYPFDPFQSRNWPFVYVQQMWGAYVAVFSVVGPDCFFFTCSTFILLQFICLQRDIEGIIKEDYWQLGSHDTFKTELVQLVNRHRELIRCVEILNIVYGKSTLFNVVTSSMTICAAGFNLMAIEDLARMLPFCAFLIFGTLQIFFYCYYGDYVMRASVGIGDAIYNSRWYEASATERKYLFTILIRSQKPCKFTAYSFVDINLAAFTRILSTAWSYFALLNQIYQK